MNFTQKILFYLISIGFLTTGCVPKSFSQELARKPSDAFPEWIEKEVELLANNFKQEVHQINPSLIIGMYPTPRDWVLKALARAFGTEGLPVLLFATHSYYKGGHEAIPRNPKEFYKRSGINAFYTAGFLFRRYGSEDLEANLYNAAKKM